jgi:acetyl esterase/lipase
VKGRGLLGLVAEVVHGWRVTGEPVPPHLSSVRNIVFARYGADALALDLFLPDDGAGPPGRRPLVVHLHGGGWTMGQRSTGIAAADIAALVAGGFVVASIDYRLAPKHRYPAPLEDLQRALEFLGGEAGRHGYDPRHIGLLGSSAGAHLALLHALGARAPAPAGGPRGAAGGASGGVRAVVDLFGPTDLGTLLRGARRRAAEGVFGAHSLQDAVIGEASPVSWVSAQAPPILVIHGDQDRIVPFEQSQLLVRRLAEVGAPVELLEVRGAGHSLRPVDGAFAPGRAEITAAIVSFFERWLR